jgi:two-component system chemotaxis response regulator CheB
MAQSPLIGQRSADQPVRVLVVDDSAFMRYTITQHLLKFPNIQVVGTGRDGQEALELIPKLQPDVVTLDVEMPRLDGLSTLKEIMADYPRPVIMLSSLTSEGALETIQALTLGAVDFVAKPSNKANINAVMDDVAQKILRAAQARVWKVPRNTAATLPIKMEVKSTSSKGIKAFKTGDPLLIIGASTGGPRALNNLVPFLPGNLPAAVLIIQHMPAGFTHSLADRLDHISPLKVKEAEPGDRLEIGKILLAPGGFHMTVDKDGVIALNQNPTVHGVRPAIDVTVTSTVPAFGKNTLNVILTGMGNDGTTGAVLVHQAGGKVFAEDESTCVVYGMPRSVVEAGVADQVQPLTSMPLAITRMIESMTH